MGTGGHLLNESTAWSIALGVVMVVAAVRPAAAAGLAGVLGIFVGVLTIYVIADAMAGAVTVTRVLTHGPVVLGAVLAVLVWRRTPHSPETRSAAIEPEIVLPATASRGRRRGHLWPTDGSAA
jgi:predicted anti-sigma-YlaC factor YlaD